MGSKIHMPGMQTPIAVGKSRLSIIWAKFLRELMILSNAEIAPGRVAMFELSAADLIDPTKFVQAGSTAGLGSGDFLGWAYCNGNNGTTDRVAEFAVFTTLSPLMRL